MGFFYPEWQKIIRIGVTTPPTTTGYQVKVEIPWQPGMKDDFSDLRFSDYYRTLPYWIESSTARTSAVVWVKLTEINEACREFFCYFSNGSAVSESNGDNIFELFDDFVGSSLGSKWTDSTGGHIAFTNNTEVEIHAHDATARQFYSVSTWTQPYAMRTRLKTVHSGYTPPDNVGPTELIGLNVNATAIGSIVYLALAEPLLALEWNNYTGSSNLIPITGWSAATYHIIDIIRDGTTKAIYKVDNANLVNHATGYTYQAANVQYYVRLSGAGETIDWVLIRKYQSTEPTCTPAESGINTAWYIGVLRAKHILVSITLTAVQHLTHIDLTWSE
jgi:hypothetical protein